MTNKTHTELSQKGFVHNVLLIIIGFVIIAILIGFFSGGMIKNVFAPDQFMIQPVQKNQPPVSSSENTQLLKCGLAISSPKSNDFVGKTIVFSGYINGCGWTAFEGTVGGVQVFDGDHKPITSLQGVQSTTEWTKLPVYFKTTISLPASFPKGNGFIVFINEDPSGMHPKKIEIPVVFQ